MSLSEGYDFCSNTFWKLLTHFVPLVSFDTPPENRKPKVSWCFQGVSKETSGMKWVDVYSKYCTRLNHANVTERSIKYIHYFYQLIYSLIGQLVFRSHDFILLFLFRLQATPSSNSTPLSICNIVKSPGQFFFAVLYNFVNNVTMNSKGCEKKPIQFSLEMRFLKATYWWRLHARKNYVFKTHIVYTKMFGLSITMMWRYTEYKDMKNLTEARGSGTG